jgi:hypothetical protein
MRNLFRAWPRENLAQIYIESATSLSPDFDVCQKYWKLSPWTVVRSHLGFNCWDELPIYQKPDMPRPFTHTPYWRRFFMKVATFRRAVSFLEPARELLFNSQSLVTPNLARWIKNFHPDLIYSMLGNNIIMRLATDVSSLAAIPIIPHFLDDWPSTQYEGSPFSKSLRSQMNHFINQVLARSPIRLTICDAMAREYELRYGGEFRVFGNSLDSSNFSQVPPPCQDTVQLTYVGGLHLNRWETLWQLGVCLQKLDRLGIKAKLKVFTFAESVQQFKERLFMPPVLELVGSLEQHEVSHVLCKSDILVHVESFREKDRKYARLSLSTKIPEYLMAGRCILACGPAEAASIQYVRDKQVGVALTTDDPRLIEEELGRLVSDRNLRASYGCRAREVGVESYENQRQSSKFQRCLTEVLLRSEKSGFARDSH